MREFTAIAQALADRQRVRLLLALQGGERCVCQLTALLGLADSTVSKHLSVLYQAGLVESRKNERWVYYRLPERPQPCVRQALKWLKDSLGDSPDARADAARLRQIVRVSPRELCRQRHKSPNQTERNKQPGAR